MAVAPHASLLTNLAALDIVNLWGTIGDELASQGLLETDLPDWPASRGKASGIQKGRVKRLANATAWDETCISTNAAAFKKKDDAFWEGPGLILVEHAMAKPGSDLERICRVSIGAECWSI